MNMPSLFIWLWYFEEKQAIGWELMLTCCFFLSKPEVTLLEYFISGKSAASPCSFCILYKVCQSHYKGSSDECIKTVNMNFILLIIMDPYKVKVLGRGMIDSEIVMGIVNKFLLEIRHQLCWMFWFTENNQFIVE